MKKLVSVLVSMSVLLSLATGCSGKKPSSSRTRRTTAEDSEPASAPEEEYTGSETAIFTLDPASASGPNATEEELRQAYTQFVFGVMKRCIDTAGTGNVLLSPDSILFALEMTAAGANGETLDQMLQTMMPGVGNAEGFQFAVERMNSLKNESLKIANSVWINENDAGSVYSQYTDYVKRHFDASISILPFDNKIVKTINGWVEEKTDGMITNLLDESDVDNGTLMVLVNAISFESEWADKYSEDDIWDGHFYTTDGESLDVSYLSSEESIYLEGADATGFIKPYKDGKYGFMAILPDDETVDVNRYLADMTPEEYWSIWESRSHEEVRVYFPEFTSDYKVDLPDVLMDMGMTDAFEPGRADFRLMTSAGVYISNVIHQTHIEVSREGTKAAAATAVTMQKNAAGPSLVVRCDRPFVYAIVDLDTGLPVFLGTCETV